MTQPVYQSTHCVLMVRPACFFSNPETALTNEFQQGDDPGVDGLARARREFDAAVGTLRSAGVDVIVADDTEDPETPDAVFPNNWLTTHADGTCVMYPMQPLSRRGERRVDVVQSLRTVYGRDIRRLVDWSGFEHENLFLEGTGSMVLDRVNRVAYACISARTDRQVLDHFCHEFDYVPIAFCATSASGTAIYHTNVMMCVGSGYAVVCLEAIDDAGERAKVRESLARHHDVIDISLEQVARFAGNMLELRGAGEKPLLVMSSTAYEALSDTQRGALAAHAELVTCAIESIESASGGSIRCMLAEIFLPQSS